jgi:hypothetical protein
VITGSWNLFLEHFFKALCTDFVKLSFCLSETLYKSSLLSDAQLYGPEFYIRDGYRIRNGLTNPYHEKYFVLGFELLRF